MKRSRSKNNSFCALKLDMMKAYDRVEWDYLEAIMLKLGFSRARVSIVVRLITTVSFAVLFNEVLQEEFRPTRGIRQDDPISSPYLFLLAAEGLSCFLNLISHRTSEVSRWLHRLWWLITCYSRITSYFSRKVMIRQWRHQTCWISIVMLRVKESIRIILLLFLSKDARYFGDR
jgi:hypothetical protein